MMQGRGGLEMSPSFSFPRQSGEGKVKPRAVDNFGESREEMGKRPGRQDNEKQYGHSCWRT